MVLGRGDERNIFQKLKASSKVFVFKELSMINYYYLFILRSLDSIPFLLL